MILLRKIVAWSAVALAAGILVLFAIPSYRQGEASVAGKRAADFPLRLSGKPAHLSDLRGQVVVLNFWLSSCQPCIEETPALNRLQQHIAGRGGVVLGISVDDDETAYEHFLKDQSVVFLTDRDASQKIASDYGTFLYPETYIIDRQGKLLRKIIGGQPWDSPQMLEYFDAILAQK